MRASSQSEHDPEYDAAVGRWMLERVLYHLLAGLLMGMMIGLWT